MGHYSLMEIRTASFSRGCLNPGAIFVELVSTEASRRSIEPALRLT